MEWYLGCTLLGEQMGERMYAMERFCPHAGGDFTLGDIEDFGDDVGQLVACPLHMFTFNLDTGKCVTTPSCPAAKVYALEVIGGSVYISTTPENTSTRPCYPETL
jgi:nitrite reductase/ring-hydroxylating ferredoxin subunit